MEETFNDIVDHFHSDQLSIMRFSFDHSTSNES
jgi:hypothetical protein